MKRKKHPSLEEMLWILKDAAAEKGVALTAYSVNKEEMTIKVAILEKSRGKK